MHYWLILHLLKESADDLSERCFSSSLVDGVPASQVHIVAAAYSLQYCTTMCLHSGGCQDGQQCLRRGERDSVMAVVLVLLWFCC